VVGVVESKNNLGFELCSPFLTSTPSFIQIGTKIGEVGILGWVRAVKNLSLKAQSVH